VSSAITIVTSIVPAATGKAYRLEPDGNLTKHVTASITRANGLTVKVPTAADMVTVLRKTTETNNEALILSSFLNDNVHGKSFEIVTEGALESLLGQKVGEEGIYGVNGKRMAARVKRGMLSSSWILLDFDSPLGMPDQWKTLAIRERLTFLEKVLPGISKCERIELRSSSARVITGSGAPPDRTHAFVRVSHASKIEVLREYLKVVTVIEGLSFETPRRSRKEPGKVIGREHRTLIDLAVLVPGRLVFNAKPDVSQAQGYHVIDAGIRLVNRGGGPLDISAVKLPDKPELARYRNKTGTTVTFSKGARLQSVVRGPLTMETEIEVCGVVKALAEWTADMKPGDKLRCETPFRASNSEAAFIAMGEDGSVILHDVGTSTTYPLTPTFPDDQEDEETGQKAAGNGSSPKEEGEDSEAPDETD
jgi:hypothetical protein